MWRQRVVSAASSSSAAAAVLRRAAICVGASLHRGFLLGTLKISSSGRGIFTWLVSKSSTQPFAVAPPCHTASAHQRPQTHPCSQATTFSDMRTRTTENERPPCPDRYFVRLSGDLAALLGDVELPEDELLGWLRAKGLITYPSPLLGRLVGKLPVVFKAEVLPRLEPIDRAMCARVGSASRAAVVASDLPRAGARQGGRGVPLKLQELCGSVERLAWARENGCPLVVPRPCGCVSDDCVCGGGCGWDVRVCHEVGR